MTVRLELLACERVGQISRTVNVEVDVVIMVVKVERYINGLTVAASAVNKLFVADDCVLIIAVFERGQSLADFAMGGTVCFLAPDTVFYSNRAAFEQRIAAALDLLA